jgi:type I restriction enzyme M protein
MELREIVAKSKETFEINDISDLKEKLREITLNNKIEYYDKFVELVQDLSIDWLQKIFQYYEADRKEKMQDYTPISLAKLIGRLTQTNDESVILDLCAGSGALTIQNWNLNNNLKFICKEFDENVIPLLIFNLAVRNIEAEVIHCDVLQDEIFAKYKIIRSDKYGKVEVAA